MSLCKKIYDFLTLSTFQTKYIPPRWGRRLRGLFWIPVLMMNYISSLIFFSGETISPIYAYRFFIEGKYAS